MSNMFYRAFEERFRGSRELIKSRLQVYLSFIEPLKLCHRQPQALDLGCGRGEWLELLQQHHFPAKGVDLDEGMLLACKELNLDVLQYDAIEYIKNLRSESLSIISAFHLVEHIPFETLRLLIDEAHRVLKPGGLLIMETPNSENLLVGTSSFYIDPTHQRPVPASLLSFLTEYAKFERVKTIFLQEDFQLPTGSDINLRTILEGVSPDYAVIAQKGADASMHLLFDEPFQREYGTRLLELADRYDQQLKAHIQWCHTEIQQLHTIYSKTWQIGLRAIERLKKIKRLMIKIIKYVGSLIKRTSKFAIRFILRIIRKIVAKIGLKERLAQKLIQYPQVKYRLRQIAIRLGLIDRIPLFHMPDCNDNSSENLSPRAAKIYVVLDKVLKEREK